jgi:hypothetical protein
MNALGGQVAFRDAARAYYCGHLGKYIPGKAMVLVIRATLMKDRGCPAAAAAITASYETLTMMGTGLAVGLALAPLLAPRWFGEHAPGWSRSILETIVALGVAIIVAASLPLVSRLLTWIAIKATPGARLAESPSVRIPAWLIGAGCAAFVVSWSLQGLSLGVTLYAVARSWPGLAQWPMWTGAMALSTSLGFAVLFAPGGLGVREGILLGILSGQPGLSPQAAVVATVLSRVVSFASEVVVASSLYAGVRGTLPPVGGPIDD